MSFSSGVTRTRKENIRGTASGSSDVLVMNSARLDWNSLDMSRGGTVNVWIEGVKKERRGYLRF